jgi:outer membrane protein
MKITFRDLLFRIVALVALSVIFTFPQDLLAEDVVYVVDMQRVISESILGRAAKNNIESELKKKELKLAKLGKELKALRENFSKQASLLSDEALVEKQEQFSQRERDFARKVQDEKDELSRLNHKELGKVVKEIDRVVNELARDKGYRFILEKDPKLVVFAANRLDLTEQIITILNKKKLEL